MNQDIILKAAEETGCIVTAENHNVLGGLGSAVSEVVTAHRLGVKDSFGEVGRPEWLAEKFEISASHIGQAVEEGLQRKSG